MPFEMRPASSAGLYAARRERVVSHPAGTEPEMTARRTGMHDALALRTNSNDGRRDPSPLHRTRLSAGDDASSAAAQMCTGARRREGLIDERSSANTTASDRIAGSMPRTGSRI
jgi:hypothetical protein